MAEIIAGTPTGLRFNADWTDQHPSGSAAGATRGRLMLWIGDTLVWGAPSNGQPLGLDWSWVELIEYLAETWPHLEWEEGYPLGLDAPTPRRLREVAETRWQGLSDKLCAEEEKEVFEFEETHDLARALQGALAPSVWLLREGNAMIVESACRLVRRPVMEVLQTLAYVGDAIVARLAAVADARANAAVGAWRRKRERPIMELTSIVTRIPESLLPDVFGADLDLLANAHFELDELLVAARMVAGRLAPVEIKKLLALIKTLPRIDSPRLNALSGEATDLIRAVASEKPFNEGYELAAWLRQKEGLGGTDRAVNPERFLVELGVPVRDVEAATEQLDAIACWGPRHGPGVLVNRRGRHAQSPQGRAATLAHELCHLLVDRSQALPVVELLNGSAPRWTEARARAFAAELLLPREIAGATITRATTDLEPIIQDLCVAHGVSRELAAWQIYNSSANLSDALKSQIQGFVSDPEGIR